MPGKRIKDLTPLSGAGSANNDDVVIFDADADATKRISRSQLAEGMQGDVQVFSNKTINLGSNTLTGTTAQFNTALSDNNFATQAGSETLTNKTIDSANNTLTVNYKEARVETSDASRTHLFTTVAALLADTGTYMTYAAGQIVEAGGFRYQVAASGASDHHVTTAGGVKLYVLPVDGVVSVDACGAVGDGVADDTTECLSAFAAVPAGGKITFTAGKTYKVSDLNLTGKSVVVSGYGASIVSTATNGAIYKTDHGNKLIVEGLSFTGSGAGVNQTAAIQLSSQDELDIVGCSFNMDSGVYGIKIVGGRNPRINGCFFRNTTSGNGCYFKDTVSPFLFQNTFKGGGYVGRAIYYPGTGNGTDAGLVIRDCEVLGWDKGVEVVGCDWLVIDGSTIDYCNQSIKLGSQDRANISNNYIGSLGVTPALWITYDAAGVSPGYSEKIFVINNTFTGHYEASGYDCILVDGTNSPDSTVIMGNSISFYTRYGINFSLVSTRLSIVDNTFAQRTGFGVAPIYNALGAADSGVRVEQNYFGNPTTIAAMNLSAIAEVNHNINCITEARGEVVVGAGVTTVNVAHGCSYTPAKSDVSLSPTNSEAASKNPFVSAVDATNITIGFTTATAANAGVGWRVYRGA